MASMSQLPQSQGGTMGATDSQENLLTTDDILESLWASATNRHPEGVKEVLVTDNHRPHPGHAKAHIETLLQGTDFGRFVQAGILIVLRWDARGWSNEAEQKGVWDVPHYIQKVMDVVWRLAAPPSPVTNGPPNVLAVIFSSVEATVQDLLTELKTGASMKPGYMHPLPSS